MTDDQSRMVDLPLDSSIADTDEDIVSAQKLTNATARENQVKHVDNGHDTYSPVKTKSKLQEKDTYTRVPQSQSDKKTPPSLNSQLSAQDLDTIKKLDEEYERALLEREIVWNARYMSVRRNARSSIYFMILFFIVGIIFYELETDWSVSEIVLFSVYTITTVGYGYHDIPSSPLVLLFTVIYMFAGIATLTILAAQLYQWILLEISWAQYTKDKNDIKKNYQQSLKASIDIEQPAECSSDDTASPTDKLGEKKAYDEMVRVFNSIQETLKKKSWGPLVAVLVPWSFFIFVGALTVGLIEKWTFAESLYFAVVSLTTVGYGDYYPTKFSSMWFCVFWLPSSVGFMSLYLGSVAHLYYQLSEHKIMKIEKKMRKQFHVLRQKQEEEREEALRRLASGGFDLSADFNMDDGDSSVASCASSFASETYQDVPTHINSKRRITGDHKDFTEVRTKSPSAESRREILPNRREAILMNSLPAHHGEKQHDCDTEQTTSSEMPKTMQTLKQTIKAVKSNMSSSRRSQSKSREEPSSSSTMLGPNETPLSLHSTKHYSTADGIEKKPTFALRVLVQERVAKIIAHEIAGYQSRVDIKENTLSVTIDTLKETTDKWLVPKRARRAFRTVAFEALYFVGERDLIVLGPDAILNLKPSEVQGLFGPFLAALGDADTMEVWLSRTDNKANNELPTFDDTDSDQPLTQDQLLKLESINQRRIGKATLNLTTNPSISRRVIGNAFSL